MIRNYIFYVSTFILWNVLIGCNKQDDGAPVDNTPPTVNNVLLNGFSPGDEIYVAPGSEMDFDATFSDNQELGQYRIDIHDDFEEHGHERFKSEPFSFDQVYDLSGTEQTVHEHIDIPENATPGQYHFTLYYFDAAGNQGQEVVIDFIISDPESLPAINIVNPNFDEEIETTPGETIVLEGTVTDPDGLEEVHIILSIDDHGHENGRLNDEEPIYEMEYELDGAISFNFEDADPILIPENATPGHYELTITAKDVLGNISIKKAEVHID